MGFPDYKKDLANDEVDINYILDRYFHSGESHAFVGAPPGEEAKLKNEVARALYAAFQIRVHPYQLVICGSAHLGFSPVPDKFGKPFDPANTDIDLAVVSPELFDQWWTELQTSGLDEPTRTVVSRDLFFGFMNPANIRDVSSCGMKWWQVFGGIKTDRAQGVRGRLYRNFWSMQSYHRLAVVWGRQRLLSQTVGSSEQSTPLGSQ